MAESGQRDFLVIRLGSLGDIVHTMPAVAALRRSFPQAKIDWAVEEKWSPLIEMLACIDQVVRVQRTFLGQVACIRRVRSARYRCAVDFQGLYKSALIGWLGGANRRIGRDKRSARESGAARFYTERVSPRGRHVAEMSVSVAEKAGAGASGSLEFPLCAPQTARQTLAAKLSLQGVANYAVVSPGGGWISKCWPAERYGMLCDELWRRRGLRAIVNAGPGEEELARRVLSAAGEAKPLVLQLDIAELAALLAQAQIVIAADTGPLHLAAALGTRVVALFGPTDPERNGPLPRGRVLCNERGGKGPLLRGNYERGKEYSPEMMSLSLEQVFAATEEELTAKG